ncbi:MAG: alpha/beta hydrolase [Bryobacterales bacterium]|nr:alpha/beta hydrolase [Bryobacterales bacterium]
MLRAWLAAMVKLPVLGGAAYQAIAWQLDARRSPEAGRLIDIAGVRRQLHCTGRGKPRVILESGLGDTLEQWRRVQPGVAAFARVCSYDRAGYGNSGAGAFPRTSERIAAELHELLRAAGENPPYVLVGSSAGGYHVRVFHGQYPADVAAMVLVDATQEDQYKLLPAEWRAMSAAMVERYRRQARWAPLEVELGILRWQLPAPVPYLLLQTRYFRARASEIETIEVSAEQARAAGTLGNKPLIVLTGGREAEELRAIPDFQRVWVHELQPRLAALSTRGRHIVLPDSGHDIPSDRPDAIVEAIREVRRLRAE